MKKFLLHIFLFTASVSVFAQDPSKQSATNLPSSNSDGNNKYPSCESYEITLSVKEDNKELKEMTWETIDQDFSASMSDPFLTLSGNFSGLQSNTILVNYQLTCESLATIANSTTTNSTQCIQGLTSARIHLDLGKAKQILKTGSMTYTLKISQLPEKSSKN
jgi:hypothetical protein